MVAADDGDGRVTGCPFVDGATKIKRKGEVKWEGKENTVSGR